MIYIHIPFCDSKCNYCAFNSYTSLNKLKNEYMSALFNQIENYFKLNKSKKIKSIFIGGGTPSTIKSHLYIKIFDYLEKYIDSNTEITSEINPSVEISWIQEMSDLGVNRFSMGVQSFNDEKLKFLGRNHSSKQAIKIIEYLNKTNVKFSIDLIYDCLGDSKEILKKDISYIKHFNIKHISAYSLIIEKNTKFENKHNYKLDDDDMAIWVSDEISKTGLIPYEVSNFAKSSKYRSIHNMGYWQKKDYLGFGAGAIGCINNKRVYNKKDIKQYIKNQDIDTIEIISKEDSILESIFLGFRSIVGVETSLIKNKERLQILLKARKIYQKENRVYLNDFFLADEVSLYLDT